MMIVIRFFGIPKQNEYINIFQKLEIWKPSQPVEQRKSVYQLPVIEMFTGFAAENIHLTKKVGVTLKWPSITLNAKIARSRRKISKMPWLIEYRLTVGQMNSDVWVVLF